MNFLSFDHLLDNSNSHKRRLRCLAWERHLSRMESGSEEFQYFEEHYSSFDELIDPNEIEYMLSHDLDFLYNEKYSKNLEALSIQERKSSRPLLNLVDSIPTLIDKDLSSKKTANINHERSLKSRSLVPPQTVWVNEARCHRSKASKINQTFSSGYDVKNKYRKNSAEFIIIIRHKKKKNIFDHSSSCSSLSSIE